MKYAVFVLVLSFLGCASKAPPPKAPEHVQLSDCLDVYTHVLSISLRHNVENSASFSEDQRRAALMILHQNYMQTGATQKFFGHCINHLNVNQTFCMVNAASLEGMDSCETKFKN